MRIQFSYIGALSSALLALVSAYALWHYTTLTPSLFYYSSASAQTHSLHASWASILIYFFGGIASWCCVLLLALCVYACIYTPFSKKTIAYSLLGCMSIVFVSALCAAYHVDLVKGAVPGGYIGYTSVQILLGMLHSLFLVRVVLYIASVSLLILATQFAHMPFACWLYDHAHAAYDYIRAHKLVQKTAYACGMCVVWIAQKVYNAAGALWQLLNGHTIERAGMAVPDEERAEHELMRLLYSIDAPKETETQEALHEELFESAAVALEDAVQEDHAPVYKAPPVVQETKKVVDRNVTNYALPGLHIFAKADEGRGHDTLTKELEEKAAVLKEKLERFGITGTVTAIKRGPVVTLYEYQPDIDIKISKILSLEDDLALALQALSIRIIAPIPGTAVVGFEVANIQRQPVLLSSIVHSKLFVSPKFSLPLAIGVDTIGESVIVDLVKMPHLLVAGSTGSGKSVALNAMLVSLLCRCTPEEMKLILIDPKRLEFSSYADIAHLLFPIVTDPRRASPILRWVVKQMEERYELMAEHGVRTIKDYNVQVHSGALRGEHIPFIVVVIDELSDLMMTVGRDVEDSIARIAQMARAAGIHLIVATQRPSVDVITGLIKVNFPSRISFRVTSKVDSRTILDTGGAEKLLGRGDMLFSDSTTATLKRLHGAYVSDKEIQETVAHIRAEREPSYLDITEELMAVQGGQDDVDDELYTKVLTFLDDVDEISISLLQRTFRIGYNRSARIIDQLEKQGRIMPPEGSKPRKVVR